jgi:hypothetical protein
MKIRLELAYKVPSLNVLLNQHWSQARYREKLVAMDALLSALLTYASDPLIQITSREGAKLCSTAYATLALYRTTIRPKSSLRLRVKKSANAQAKKRSSN